MSKTFLEKHAAAMVCHRQEFTRDHYQHAHAAFNAVADYADELAARIEELQDAPRSIASGLPGGIAAR